MNTNAQYLKPLPGTDLKYYDARAACEAIAPGSYDTLPYTSRILAENLVNRADNVDQATLDSWLTQLIERKQEIDFPWFPARVVCHDILGQTALVDLAGLRDAIADKGGNPSKVNPVVQTQLIVDHSLAVECGGFDPDAFQKNRDIEDRRNEDRFHFINWTKTAFENVDVIPAGNGIMHQINLEKMSPVVQVKTDKNGQGVAFPDTCVGTDSHTPHVDALGVISVGVGGLEAETVMLGRASMMRLPDIVGVELTGKRQSGITATDIVLALTEFLRKERVVGAFVEFYGEGAESLSVGDRATISNMTPEYGATAGMFYIDQQTIDYLKLTGRDDAQVKLVETYAKTAGLWASELKNAVYPRVLTFDLSTVGRNMAGPSNPHARFATADLAAKGLAAPYETPADGKMPDGAVIIAAITSCTNTSNPRNVVAAALLARNANKLGLIRKPWVKSSFAPGSKVAEIYLQEAGLLSELEQLGFGIVAFACTTCNGMSGALDPQIQQEIIDRDLYATAVLSGNRNFDGRIHPYAKQAFLASPPLVVAYAIAGSIRFDIENDVLGVSDGKEIRLKDIWPTDEEIDAIVAEHVKPQQFRDIYIPMFDTGAAEKAPSPLYDWRPMSTYIRRPPYWEGALAGERTLKGMRPLAILPDNITTDHLSPSNAILMNSAAGEYLHKMGLPEEDFNSYATHRGDHLTAQRATFANPKLFNEMVKNEDGTVKQGSLARVEPEGQTMRMWEAIETYMNRKQPLIIVAGADYGQGSSRDWAAKGVRLAGVEAIVAEGFERIHRTNLIGMGVLPLQFLPGTNRKTLELGGTETYDVIGERIPRGELTLLIHRANGETVKVPVTSRLDTAEEVLIYEAGGVLQRFAQDFLEGNAA
ncbi:Fe/S-dependent 2-methylisocitrate dehydratase AcnD [Paralysiella testudinis]|uniref:aconitate hydratase n=1 Tax=Paralysiella testudinis TaxID=2809020 RepID=A0A892ZDR5_9NEIS|nr:Fe/S-dependent 2-methylisocitrate dehydratase AcnD [Paralysiella testudinis]QRQ80648.1 Fe/S-dependent 2-methylisocitrate dehydratase AcnD [Paralysiella testudinis]